MVRHCPGRLSTARVASQTSSLLCTVWRACKACAGHGGCRFELPHLELCRDYASIRTGTCAPPQGGADDIGDVHSFVSHQAGGCPERCAPDLQGRRGCHLRLCNHIVWVVPVAGRADTYTTYGDRACRLVVPSQVSEFMQLTQW